MMRNHPEFVESMVAASITATAFVPVDPRTRGEKLVYMLRNAGCRGVVCADYCLLEVSRARATGTRDPVGTGARNARMPRRARWTTSAASTRCSKRC